MLNENVYVTEDSLWRPCVKAIFTLIQSCKVEEGGVTEDSLKQMWRSRIPVPSRQAFSHAGSSVPGMKENYIKLPKKTMEPDKKKS